MSNTTTPMTPELQAYVSKVGYREHPVLAELRRRTGELSTRGMQIAPEQGAFMSFLLRTMEARRVLELGTFTGYSSLAMALALPPEGRVTCLDRSEEWTSVAREFWGKGGVSAKMELRLGDAGESLDALLAEGREGYYDFAFIDADKESLGRYFEKCLTLVRPGGVIGVDNTLWNGSVADTAANDADTQAIRAFNEGLAADSRVEMCLLPVGDGLSLARRAP